MNLAGVFAGILLLLLSGCATQQAPEKFDVAILDAIHEDVFLSEENKTLENITFIIHNKEAFELDCNLLVNLNNKTEDNRIKKHIGPIKPDDKKRVSLVFEMFFGDTDLEIFSECKKSGTQK
jgi:hypothetical protein